MNEHLVCPECGGDHFVARNRTHRLCFYCREWVAVVELTIQQVAKRVMNAPVSMPKALNVRDGKEARE